MSKKKEPKTSSRTECAFDKMVAIEEIDAGIFDI